MRKNCVKTAVLCKIDPLDKYGNNKFKKEMIYVLGNNTGKLDLPFLKEDRSIFSTEDLIRVKEIARQAFAAT